MPSPHADEPANRDFLELLRQARAGSREASGQLLESHKEHLLPLARSLVPRQLMRKADPDDLVQETMISAYRQLDHFRGTSSAQFAWWLRQILRHAAGDILRAFGIRRKRLASLEQPLDANLAIRQLAIHCCPCDLLIRRELAAALQAALEELPLDYQQVLRLRYYEGLSYHQVGDDLLRSEDAVRKLGSRARQMLKWQLLSREVVEER